MTEPLDVWVIVPRNRRRAFPPITYGSRFFTTPEGADRFWRHGESELRNDFVIRKAALTMETE